MKTANPTELATTLKTSKKTLVAFSAPWCGPCKVLTPILEEVENETNREDCQFVKVDIDTHQELAAKYEIKAVPTTILFENEEITNTNVGLLQKEEIKTFINGIKLTPYFR
jgi:thioredoxin 1